jgi:succinyl-CoA synthetase beta subunit
LRLYEYESKKVLASYGVPFPKGDVNSNILEVSETLTKIKPPVAVKAQVLVAGRGSAGGVLFANSVEEAEKAAEKLLNTHIKGLAVKRVLIEEKIPIKREFYLGITIDRAEKTYVAIASAAGGIEIEETAEKAPEAILRVPIDPERGLRAFQARQIGSRMGCRGDQLLELERILEKLYQAGMDLDAELIEINPLVETSDGKFVAVDARIIIDDNALFRHPEYQRKLFEGERDLDQQEIEALRNGLTYVKLDGNIAVMGNGAGLVMATLDLISDYGGKPANFLDLGGGAATEKIATATGIVLSPPNVKSLLINILGGITKCDDVARGILEAKARGTITKPFVIRLVGAKEEEGKRMLTEAGIPVSETMEEAAQQAVEIAEHEAK